MQLQSRSATEKKYMIFAGYVNSEEQHVLGFFPSTDDIFYPILMSQHRFTNPKFLTFNVPGDKPNSYKTDYCLLAPQILQGRLMWRGGLFSQGSFSDNFFLINSLYNSLRKTKVVKGDDFYLAPKDDGFYIVQKDYIQISFDYNIFINEAGELEHQIAIEQPENVHMLDEASTEGYFAKTYYETLIMTDGQPLDCLITKPPFGTAPYPAIVMPHGGPHVKLMLDYKPLIQFLANCGYVVIEPAFSGSENSFSIKERGRGQYGNLIQREMNEAARWYAKNGLIDATRGGMLGASFGGYVMNYQATHPEEFREIFPAGFKCFISNVGVSDLKLSIEELFENILRKNRIGTEDQIRYMEPLIQDVYAPLSAEVKASLKSKSPLFAAHNIKAPFLLLHNDLDKRVSIQHSNQLSQA